MTTQELQDLRQWAAEKVMGWRGGKLTSHAGPRDMFDRTWYFKFDANNPVMTTGDWHPDTDLNQTFMVVEKMRELGFEIRLENSEHFLVQFYKKLADGFESTVIINSNPCLAILLAARAALEGSDG